MSCEFVPRGETVNEESYLTHFTVSLRMNVAVSRRILAGAQIVCMLQQCCMHMTLFVQQGLGEKTLLFPEPPYSADISPAIFLMFQN